MQILINQKYEICNQSEIWAIVIASFDRSVKTYSVACWEAHVLNSGNALRVQADEIDQKSKSWIKGVDEMRNKEIKGSQEISKGMVIWKWIMWR